MDKFKLDDQEQEIEDSAQEYVPVDDAERERIEGAIARSRKNKNINIRLSEADLERIRTKADQEGLPYQTLISSVLHKYVSDRLVDEDQVIKTLELIGKTPQS
jgi:predicted DNA binding CopG/RHH family protein